MQLWKKNFLAVYLLLLLVIYGGLLLLDAYISKNEMELWVERARNSEKSICDLAEGLKEEEISRISMGMNRMAERFLTQGVRIRIRMNTYIAADSFQKWDRADGPVEIQNWKGIDYLVIREERNVEDAVIEVMYAENLEGLSQPQARRMWIFCGGGFLFAAVLGLFLYYTMRRINRPVNQIAHELRTPLTGIRGYAEYMMMGGLTEEDQFYAAQQIVESARSLEDITEKLLIMGNVRKGSIRMERIRVGKVLGELKEKYPGVETVCQAEAVDGDATLVRCLLENLTANAVNAGQQVRVTVDEVGIKVWNDGETLDAGTVRALNRGQELQNGRGGRHGYGISVCQEIAKVHGWRLVYRSVKEEGTTVVCQFGS